MKNYTQLMVILTISFFTACSNDGVTPESEFEVIASSGSTTSLDGVWNSGCVTDTERNLSETMIIEQDRILLNILIFEDDQCNNLVDEEDVIIQFTVEGAIQAVLDEELVSANKITGTATQGNSVEPFKQTLYLDDSGDILRLYHARFGDDGGQTNTDGFPIELIPISINKQ